MLTLITGTPGAGKTLYAVSQIAAAIPGSTIENGQTAVKRVLFSNVKDMIVEHEIIGADEMNVWHEWAKPGAVILFDEVQEVWRGRSTSSKVPECIAKLETHRHMGVDIVIVTQHPMLIDQNIRRLVNQHIHVRRISKGVSMLYEWDHCENPGNTKTSLNSRVWWHPKSAYKLYKSAQLHTKTKARMPAVMWLGVAALGALAYVGPMAYGRINNTFGNVQPGAVAVEAGPEKVKPTFANGFAITSETTVTESVREPSPVEPVQTLTDGPRMASGCIAVAGRCGCLEGGQIVKAEPEKCLEQIGTDRPVADVSMLQDYPPKQAVQASSIDLKF